MMTDIFLAVAGDAVAVAFPDAEPGEHVRMTRHVTREAMVPVEVLSGGPVAFQGMGSDAALFGPRSYGEATRLREGRGECSRTRALPFSIPA